MRAVNVLIVLGVAVGIGFGAYKVGHAVDGPAKQLDTVVALPAEAAGATAESNLEAAVSAAASYRIDHGSYAGLTTSELRSYDRAIARGVSVRAATAGGYCVESTVHGTTMSIRGPNGSFVARRC